MSTRNFRNHCARNKRLLNHPGLVILREPATSARPRDHLLPVHSLRLKRMVKHRHKPISESEIVTLANRKSHLKGAVLAHEPAQEA